jgi:hypothetical protein
MATNAQQGGTQPSNQPDRSQQKRKHDQAFMPHDGDAGAGGDEVGGRHAVRLVDGTIGYHSDWVTGPYIWIVDQDVYYGPHWHPNRYSPIAHDIDG